MHYADLIHLYFERSSALQWYWTIYVIIIGGLLAFSSLRQRPDAVTEMLVTILFIFFAYKNGGAIGDVTFERYAILDAIKKYPIAAPTGAVDNTAVAEKQLRDAIEPTLNPPEWGGLTGTRNFHITSDVIVVATLWAMELRRRRAAKAARAVVVSGTVGV